MLQCVCSVINHGWHQNVVRTKKCRQCDTWCSYHMLTSSVIYYWTDTQQHGIYLFNKETNYYFFILNSFIITRKPTFAYFGEHKKLPLDNFCCLYKMKQSHWLPCGAKNCHWSRKITPLSNLNDFSWNENLQQNSNANSLQIHKS